MRKTHALWPFWHLEHVDAADDDDDDAVHVDGHSRMVDILAFTSATTTEPNSHLNIML